MGLGSPRPGFSGTRRFDIVREIGFGGAGVVYEAFDRERNGRVALKLLRALGAEARLRFKAEFRSLQDLRHPNLVSLGELLEEDGQLFFTMELVRGVDFVVYARVHEEGDVEPPSSLRPLAPVAEERPGGGAEPAPRRRRPRFDERRLRSAVVQLVQGLTALHEAQKVHRDIKPSNVLVTADGRVVILDFGLMEDISAPRRDEQVAGTAHFIAPEQMDGMNVGPEADLYSVGVMLYLALTGDYPFRSSPGMALRLKRLVQPPPPGELVRGLPRDLEQLCMDLLRIDPRGRPSGREVLRRLQADPAEEEPTTLSLRGNFVGRQAELAALRDALQEARAGRPVAQIIEGESGVGKTALLRRFLEQIAAESLVLAGRCYERESVPYKALDGLIDALSLELSALPPDEVRPLLPPDAALLGAAFPVLRDALSRALAAAPEPRRAVDPAELRARVFAALRALFGTLARVSPLVLAIDDLQWADADSLALLAEVMRPDPGAGSDDRAVLLLGVVRAGAGAAAARLGRRLGLPQSAVRHLAVGRLPPSDAEALCAILLHGAGADAGAAHDRPLNVRALAEESGGHPLFIDALVRYRLAHDDAAPLRLDDVLGARITRLDARSRELLELAVAAGGPLFLDVAARAAQADLGELTRMLATLGAASLARTGGAGRDEFLELFHSRIRETVLALLDADARRALHGKLARALEAAGRVDLTALAEHWRAAGDPARAAGYALRAAEQAEAALAFDRAAQLYRAAVQLLPPGGEERRTTLVRLGSALSSAGQGVKAAEAFMAATEGAPPAEALELGRRAAQSLLRTGYVEAGLAALRTALTAVDLELQRSPERARASLVARRARLLRRGIGFTPREVAEIPREALARIDVCWTAALGLAIIDPVRGADFGAQNLLLSLEAGEPYRVTRALALEAAYLAGEGVPEEPLPEGAGGDELATDAREPAQESITREPAREPAAREYAERDHAAREAAQTARVAELIATAGAMAEQIGSPHARGLVGLADGVAATYLGRWPRAREALDRAERIFRDECTGVAWERGAAQSAAVWSLWYLGDLREFARRVPLYLQEAEERGDRYVAANLRSAQGNAYWLVRGDPDAAEQEAEAAIRSWSRAGYHLQIYFDLIARAHIGLYRGEAEDTYELFADRWSGLELTHSLRILAVRVSMVHLRASAALASAREAPDPAARLEEAARAARRLEAEQAPWALALAAALGASLAAARGEDEQAALRFAEAARAFEGAGMALYATAARRRAGELLAGDAGRAAVAEADRWMAERGVADPARMSALLAPLPRA